MKPNAESTKENAVKVGNFLIKWTVHQPLHLCLYLCCVCCTCSTGPHFDYCGNAKRQYEARQREKARMLSEVPPPLIARRARRLTLPLDGPGVGGTVGKRVGWRGRQSTNAQQGSQLLMLPTEVRELIWMYAMGCRDVGIVPGSEVTTQPTWIARRSWKKRSGNGKVLKKFTFCEGGGEMVRGLRLWDVRNCISTGVHHANYYLRAGETEGSDYGDVKQSEIGWQPLSVLLSCRQM